MVVIGVGFEPRVHSHSGLPSMAISRFFDPFSVCW